MGTDTTENVEAVSNAHSFKVYPYLLCPFLLEHVAYV